jgi:hypothetical protein
MAATRGVAKLCLKKCWQIGTFSTVNVTASDLDSGTALGRPSTAMAAEVDLEEAAVDQEALYLVWPCRAARSFHRGPIALFDMHRPCTLCR